jgi:hypothetical protein
MGQQGQGANVNKTLLGAGQGHGTTPVIQGQQGVTVALGQRQDGVIGQGQNESVENLEDTDSLYHAMMGMQLYTDNNGDFD